MNAVDAHVFAPLLTRQARAQKRVVKRCSSRVVASDVTAKGTERRPPHARGASKGADVQTTSDAHRVNGPRRARVRDLALRPSSPLALEEAHEISMQLIAMSRTKAMRRAWIHLQRAAP